MAFNKHNTEKVIYIKHFQLTAKLLEKDVLPTDKKTPLTHPNVLVNNPTIPIHLKGVK